MQLKAGKGYSLPQEIIEGVGAADDTMVICLDLQQALPTPRLSTNQVFYKRKMWTYNFGIHDYKSKQAHMFVWDETTANRGAAEIASCLYKFVTTFVPSNIKKLYIFSDNCPGQNKNKIIILFYLFLVHKRFFEEVYHIFFQTGHTYMNADSHFATIENAVRRQNYVFSPQCYADVIKNCRQRDPFVVTIMTQQDFYDFEQLKRRCTIRKPASDKFSDACYYKVSKAYRTGYELGCSYMQLSLGAGTKVRWAKGTGERADQAMNLNVPLVQKYLAPLPLKQAKLKDLQSYVKDLVPANIYDSFWKQILNAAPSSDSSDDDEDEPFPFMADYYD